MPQRKCCRSNDVSVEFTHSSPQTWNDGPAVQSSEILVSGQPQTVSQSLQVKKRFAQAVEHVETPHVHAIQVKLARGQQGLRRIGEGLGVQSIRCKDSHSVAVAADKVFGDPLHQPFAAPHSREVAMYDVQYVHKPAENQPPEVQ